MKFSKDFTYRTPLVTREFLAGDAVPDNGDIVKAAKAENAIEKDSADGGSPKGRAKVAAGGA